MELSLGLSSGSSGADDLNCGCAWLRKTFHRARRGKADCVCGTGKARTSVRGEFALVMDAQSNQRLKKAAIMLKSVTELHRVNSIGKSRQLKVSKRTTRTEHSILLRSFEPRLLVRLSANVNNSFFDLVSGKCSKCWTRSPRNVNGTTGG